MSTLFSYCVLYDNGAAPNPFWNTCTLAICKPAIRRNAQVGDWIIGTGSKRYDFENHMIYAMKVTEIMLFEAYDQYCKEKLPKKIPDVNSKDMRRVFGDCIYDFSRKGLPTKRAGVHTIADRKKDLSGLHVLLSKHFYYFGSEPIPLPNHLLKIVRQGQGHKSRLNEPYINGFVKWLSQFDHLKNKVVAMPYGLQNMTLEECRSMCNKEKLEVINHQKSRKRKSCI